MKFGVREICDVVLKAKAPMQVGNKIFYKNEPVIYFDTLKTSSMEGAATTVYAQGGRGNSRLMAWEGERTVTFTMEDALISPAGFMILSGAGLIDAADKPIYVHATERVKVATDGTVELTQTPASDANATIYAMLVNDNDEIVSEPIICTAGDNNTIAISNASGYSVSISVGTATVTTFANWAGKMVLVDYYVKKESGAYQIDITPDKFGGNYYLEASTLFRDTNGVDMPAEFIIPNCKIQSNFTFTMASSGDPSTFTFTMDAFPDYTKFDNQKKVLAAIQIISDNIGDSANDTRDATTSAYEVGPDGTVQPKSAG